MKSFLIKLLILLILINLGLVTWRFSENSGSSKVLSYFSQATPTPIPTLTPTPTPEPTPTLTPSPTPIPSPTPSLSPTSVPQPKHTQAEIHGFVERFAVQYSVDPNVLRHIATCESGFNASAVNGPYAGLYQFGSSAWKNNRVLMGEDADLSLRFNAEESVQTAAFIVGRGIKNIWPNCYP